MSSTETEPEGKRTNIIVTYAELASIKEGVIRTEEKLDGVRKDIGSMGKQHDDHEIRIRALELASSRQSGGQGLAQWATPILLSIIGVLFTLLNYYK